MSLYVPYNILKRTLANELSSEDASRVMDSIDAQLDAMPRLPLSSDPTLLALVERDQRQKIASQAAEIAAMRSKIARLSK